MPVNHRDGIARCERLSTARRESADFVEIDDPKTRQWGEGMVLRPAASDAGIDSDGGRKPGIDREADRLRRGLVGEEVRRCISLARFKAQGAADRIARPDWQTLFYPELNS